MIALAVFAAGLAAALWILAGYPLALARLRFREAPQVRKQPGFTPPVTAILAVHNGERFLRAKLESLLALDYPPNRLEIVVVSDGSTDATDAIAREFAPRGVRLLRAERGGKARALNLALAAPLTGEILFFTDVRQPLARDALAQLAANFADPSVGAVTGELRIVQPGTGEQADLDRYWRYELWARRRHSAIDSIFNTTGCIYAIRRDLVRPIPPDTLTDDAVIPLRAFFAGYRVIFDPAAAAYDYPTVAGGEFRRRLRTLAGLWQVHARFPELFTARNRMRLHFLSHKFGRLALPWALAAAAAASFFLPGLLRPAALSGETALAALALLDFLRPPPPLRRLTSPPRTFLAMNLAALAAVAVFCGSAERFWTVTQVDARPALDGRGGA
jgi:cellulose synthase/poly-beta-1,6-N-acetylglucosamine synthase-like glycosyltransferase